MFDFLLQGYQCKGNIESIQFDPPNGIPIACYPFCGEKEAPKVRHASAFVVAKFNGLQKYTNPNIASRDYPKSTSNLPCVECAVWAKNLGDHNDDQSADRIASNIISFKMINDP